MKKGPEKPVVVSSSSPSTAFIPLHQRLEVSITENGLLVKPQIETILHHDSVLIRWNGDIESMVESAASEECTISVCGIAGLLKGFHNDFLIVITSIDTVSNTLDPLNPIHSIKSTLAIPLSSLRSKPILEAYAKNLPKPTSNLDNSAMKDSEGEEESSEDEDDDDEIPEADEEEGEAIVLDQPESSQELSATIRLAHKPSFWKRIPFSVTPALSILKPKSRPAIAIVTPASIVEPLPPTTPDSSLPLVIEDVGTDMEEDAEVVASKMALDRKVVAGCQKELKGLYFSYTADITRSLQHKSELSTSTAVTSVASEATADRSTELPLYRQADPRFFFNSHLISPFIIAGLHSYVTVLQQGHIQQASVELPLESPTTTSEEPESTSITLDFLIISRRSIERPGLRYQRRGINSLGSVANFVETEFIVQAERDSQQHISSFVQTRGSIPLFWTQSPWGLKPIPVVDKDREGESLKAMTAHFDQQIRLYGRQIIVNLAESKGKEASVVEAYREGVKNLGKEDAVKYVEFDFHQECKGMRYENISKLTDILKEDLEDLGYFWIAVAEGKEKVFSSQTGTIRTNCVDCLDRTNVIQTALSRVVLNRFLISLGITSQEEVGLHDSLDIVFNNLWASNGDAISKEYSGTAALKGDFTRTGKRDVFGVMNDASNSVARLLKSTTGDFFHQATIDFILGVNLGAFAEYQDRLDVSDPVSLIRLSQIREEAIENSTRLVLLPGEEKLIGYTLLSPLEQDVIRSSKFIEKILLVSNKSIYIVNYDFSLQKVNGFVRIPSGDVAGIQQGPYILSSSDSGRDSSEHYGFILRYHPAQAVEKVHTFSMRVKVPLSPSRKVTSPLSSPLNESPSSTSGSIEFDTRFFAFKALRKDIVQLSSDGRSQIISKSTKEKGSCKEVVGEIIQVLREQCEKAGAVDPEDLHWIEDKPVISLSEAVAHTTYSDKLFSLSKSLQALIWL